MSREIRRINLVKRRRQELEPLLVFGVWAGRPARLRVEKNDQRAPGLPGPLYPGARPLFPPPAGVAPPPSYTWRVGGSANPTKNHDAPMRTIHELSDSPADPGAQHRSGLFGPRRITPDPDGDDRSWRSASFFRVGRRRKITASALRAWIERRQRLAVQDQDQAA